MTGAEITSLGIVAKRKLAALLERNLGKSLRIHIRSHCCCGGPQSRLTVSEAQPDDQELNAYGLTILLDKRVAAFEPQSIVDYVDFTVSNDLRVVDDQDSRKTEKQNAVSSRI